MTITTGTKLVLFGFWLGTMFGVFLSALMNISSNNSDDDD